MRQLDLSTVLQPRTEGSDIELKIDARWYRLAMIRCASPNPALSKTDGVLISWRDQLSLTHMTVESRSIFAYCAESLRGETLHATIGTSNKEGRRIHNWRYFWRYVADENPKNTVSMRVAA